MDAATDELIRRVREALHEAQVVRDELQDTLRASRRLRDRTRALLTDCRRLWLSRLDRGMIPTPAGLC